jgi:CRISPR-associated protein Cmr6
MPTEHSKAASRWWLGLVPAPPSVRKLLGQDGNGAIHPGLRLDRYLPPVPEQAQQKDRLEDVVRDFQAHRALLGYPDLLQRRETFLTALGISLWGRSTVTALTLHLARAAQLENAGLALHPIHGFPYLPGTGLKGLARGYAETVWVATQPDPVAAWRQVEAVFGWAPGSDLVRRDDRPVAKPWRPRPEGGGTLDHGPEDAAQAGAIVFHDAWPVDWPTLFVDIVNNHHPAYYQGKDAPGDWDDPVPVYFLAIQPGARFSFALGRRRDDVPEELLGLARQWLDGGLTQLGFGAKTAAGYGYFQADELSPEVHATWTGLLATTAQAPPPHVIPRAERTATLELITPAFLAGANQQKDDCDLRSATLRGQLRWWWRTLHAGFLKLEELRRLEAQIWGNTEQGAAIQTVLEPVQAAPVRAFQYKERSEPRDDFKRAHQLEDRPNNKTTQGLFYAAYGMDENSRGQRRSRFHLEPGASWRLRFTAHGLRAGSRTIQPERLLDQAHAALWLLCTFGAVGSKARKGFGSLQATAAGWEAHNLDAWRQQAHAFRRDHNLPTAFDPARVQSATLERAERLSGELIRTPWSDPWYVLDQLGFVYQSFAQAYRHQPEKASLGLPRKIHGPSDKGPRGPQRDWRPPQWLAYEGADPRARRENLRYASPVHFHIGRGPDGTLTIRAIAFAAPCLPDLDRSQAFLKVFLEHVQGELEARTRRDARRAGAGSRPAPTPHSAPRGPRKRDPGTPVRVRFLGPNKKGTGFRVQEPGKPDGSLTVGKPPASLPDVDATLDVFIHNDDPNHPQYRWDDPRAGRPTASPGHGKSPGPRRR